MLKVHYAQVMGSLMYTIISARLDIYLAVRLVSKYQSNIGKEIVIWICDLELIGYSDANFKSNVDDRIFVSGEILLLERMAVS